MGTFLYARLWHRPIFQHQRNLPNGSGVPGSSITHDATVVVRGGNQCAVTFYAAYIAWVILHAGFGFLTLA